MLFLHFLLLICLGLVFGSLGSVIFFRLGALPNWKTLKGFLFGRSECRQCHHTLHIQDLIPLRSFFSQKGRCRYCNTKLSQWYPILEIWTVIIFIGVRLIIGMKHSEYGLMEIEEVLSYPYIWYLMIGLRLLFIITLYDFKEYELHLTASFLLLILSFGGQWGEGHNLQFALQGMFIFFAVFLIIYYGAKGYVFLRFRQKAEGFGFGDVLMAGILGSIFPIFLPLSSALQRGYLVCSYLIVSCSIGILGYAIGKAFSPSTPTPSHHPQIKIPITSSGKILPFLPAMNIAFVLFVLFDQHLLKFLAYFSSSNAFF